jgi:phospholipase/carboxylesterase
MTADRAGAEPRWVVVFLHGYDDDPEVFDAVVASALPRQGFAVVTPRGPIETAPGRAAWFSSDADGLVAAEVDRALAEVDDIVTAAAEDHDLTRDRIIVGGFSQGASLALAWLLDGARPSAGIGGVISIAGWIPDSHGLTIDPSRGAALDVFAGHGADDEVVPLPLGRSAARLLERNGATVEFVEHDVGHKAGPFVDDLRDWLRALDDASPLRPPPS